MPHDWQYVSAVNVHWISICPIAQTRCVHALHVATAVISSTILKVLSMQCQAYQIKQKIVKKTFQLKIALTFG